MKKVILALFVFVAVFFTGCDTFRRLAGRPTSAEIEAKRKVIELAEPAKHQERMGPLTRIEKQMADSLAVLDSLNGKNGTAMREPARMGGISAGSLKNKYYIIVGAFMDKGNAEFMKKQVTGAGYEAELIYFRNGYTCVGVCPTDNLVEEYADLKKLKAEKFCPEDIWILVNENK